MGKALLLSTRTIEKERKLFPFNDGLWQVAIFTITQYLRLYILSI